MAKGLGLRWALGNPQVDVRLRRSCKALNLCLTFGYSSDTCGS